MDYRDMKSKKDLEKVDNNYYDEAMVVNESDDNITESKDYKNQFASKNNQLHSTFLFFY